MHHTARICGLIEGLSHCTGHSQVRPPRSAIRDHAINLLSDLAQNHFKSVSSKCHLPYLRITKSRLIFKIKIFPT